MGFFTRLASRFGTSSRSIAGFRPERGPFDEPPAEPVDLDPTELPWELRDEPPSETQESPRS